MTANDLAVVVRGMTPVIREYVASQVGVLMKTIAVLEQRLVVAESRPLIPGPNGKDADALDLDALALKAAAFLPVPKDGRDGVDGKDAEPVDLEAVAVKAAALIQVPKDGVNGRDGVNAAPVDLDAIATKAAALIPTPKDGQDGTNVDMAEVTTLVRSHLETLQPPQDGLPGKDGSSVTLDDVASLIAAEVTKAVAAMPPAKDGVGMVGTLIDRAGHLVVTLSDGTTKDVGPVVGKDVALEDVTRVITEALAKWPRPTDGVDGKDGLGFDDIEPVYDEYGRLSLRFTRGDVVKEFRIPGIVDRGVYKPETVYLKGDGVTWGSSFWVAQAETMEKPGDGVTAWRLAVKRGGDGKPGTKGLDGKPGRDGRDLTLRADGSRF